MKKQLLMLACTSLLFACANPYEVAKTEGEMAARRLESPEQTALRQKATIYEINKEIREENIADGKLHFPATCELVKQQSDKESKDRGEAKNILAADIQKKLEIIAKKEANDCKICRSKEYKDLISSYSQLLNIYETKTSFGVLLKDRDYEAERYIKKVIDLCDNIDDPFTALGNYHQEYKEAHPVIENLKTTCEKYDPEFIKERRKELKGKDKAARTLAQALMQNECLEKYPFATSEKCKCYANAFYDSIAKKANEEALRELDANEKCVNYKSNITAADNPFGFMGLGQEAVLRSAAKK